MSAYGWGETLEKVSWYSPLQRHFLMGTCKPALFYATAPRWSGNGPTHAKRMSLKFAKLLLQILNRVINHFNRPYMEENTYTWSSLVPLKAWWWISRKPFPYSILAKTDKMFPHEANSVVALGSRTAIEPLEMFSTWTGSGTICSTATEISTYFGYFYVLWWGLSNFVAWPAASVRSCFAD